MMQLNQFRFAHYIICSFFHTVAVWLIMKSHRPTNYFVQWSTLAQEYISVLNLIAASFISTGCLLSISKRRKLPLSLVIMLNRMTAATVRTGNWPALTEMPPEACNQATGQLWGPWGVHFQAARDYIFTLSFSFLLFHSHFHSHTHRRRGRHFLKSFIQDTETAFRSEQKGLFFCWAIFSIDKVPFCSVAAICMLQTVCHNGIFSHLNVAQLHFIVLKRE